MQAIKKDGEGGCSWHPVNATRRRDKNMWMAQQDLRLLKKTYLVTASMKNNSIVFSGEVDTRTTTRSLKRFARKFKIKILN